MTRSTAPTAAPTATAPADEHCWTLVPSPVGDLLLAARGDRLAAVWFLEDTKDMPGPDPIQRWGVRRDDHPVLLSAAAQLRSYFDGELTEFDLPLDPGGTDFQRRVWEALTHIGYGETWSYSRVAAELGKTAAASRAVGLANGRNPIAIVVPCHRVIGANGTLVGYAGGVRRKQFLLDHERRTAAASGAGPGADSVLF